MAGEAGRLIVATGSVRARADTFDAVLRLACEHVGRSRGEPGCISHAVHRDVEDPLRLFFFERWADRPALQTHIALETTQGFARDITALAAEPPILEIYEANEL